jgi:hypothetical protein
MKRCWREEREERLEIVNEFLGVIGSCGRGFFCRNGVLCWMYQDYRGRIWFVDSWRGDETYTHREGRWRKFCSGGTMKQLVESLRDYVLTGKQLGPRHFFWPDWVCGGDLWGYGDDMERVRAAALRLKIVWGEKVGA